MDKRDGTQWRVGPLVSRDVARLLGLTAVARLSRFSSGEVSCKSHV